MTFFYTPKEETGKRRDDKYAGAPSVLPSISELIRL
jgi:hypothetical protein